MISNKPKRKQRYLSPSFKKGAIKKEKDKEEEFKLNLILNGAEDDDSEIRSISCMEKERDVPRDSNE